MPHFQSRCGTLKNHHCRHHRWWWGSPYEWKILKWDEKPQLNKSNTQMDPSYFVLKSTKICIFQIRIFHSEQFLHVYFYLTCQHWYFSILVRLFLELSIKVVYLINTVYFPLNNAKVNMAVQLNKVLTFWREMVNTCIIGWDEMYVYFMN